MNSYYWDACVFLSLIEGHAARLPALEAIFDDCENAQVELSTSVLTIAEVAFAKSEKDNKVLDAATEANIDELWKPASPIKLAEVHLMIVREARGLMRAAMAKSWSLKCPDAIHFATAKRLGVDEIHTYDEPLYKYSSVLGITVCAPHTDKFPFTGHGEGDEKAAQGQQA